MGKDTFTGKLWEFTKQHSAPFAINVDGPYGMPLDPSGHAAMMLLAGGIGITPMHSTFRMLSQLASQGQLPKTLKHVRLVWVARSSELFSMLSESVVESLNAQKPGGAPIFQATFYINNPSDVARASSDIVELGVPIQIGRPNLSELMDSLLTDSAVGSTALVQCCGPPLMAKAVEKIAESKLGIVYQAELFDF
jgi:NAD(P)H-flavin reductase